MKRVYGGGFSWRVTRMALVSLLYLLTLSMLMAGVVMWSLVF